MKPTHAMALVHHDHDPSRAQGLREQYLEEEPGLFEAIRRDDRGRAREILNRLLVARCHRAGSDLAIQKSLLLELVVSMVVTAVEAGIDAQELLGRHFDTVTALARLKDEVALSAWLRETMEHVFDVVHRGRRNRYSPAVRAAIDLIDARSGEDLGRDEVARAVHLSPSRFSSRMRRETGRSFSELLVAARLEKADRYLVFSDLPLSFVAMECGFKDQGYFTRVFRRFRGTTPLRFRRERRARGG